MAATHLVGLCFASPAATTAATTAATQYIVALSKSSRAAEKVGRLEFRIQGQRLASTEANLDEAALDGAAKADGLRRCA